MEKIKTDKEGDAKEEAPKGRKRQKSLKVSVKETSDVSGEAGLPTGEVDPITAAIEAVLANASAMSAALEKPKKAKRARKQDQEGNVGKTKKQDADATAEDADENDDDSSTAGNEGQ